MYDNKKDALVTEKNAALRKSVSSAHLGIAASECIDKSIRAMLKKHLRAKKEKKNMNQSKIVERKERREKKRPENREARERQQRRVA